ncbi:hypothetical protein [Dankookia sp. P2]|uniref:hypothetical protein n=1 Tax=Dankookia sp. P2 TaxID=3423955 RepID=UPI003D67EEB9
MPPPSARRWPIRVCGEKAGELGFDLIGADPAESRRFVAAEVTRYAQLVAEANIRAE